MKQGQQKGGRYQQKGRAAISGIRFNNAHLVVCLCEDVYTMYKCYCLYRYNMSAVCICKGADAVVMWPVDERDQAEVVFESRGQVDLTLDLRLIDRRWRAYKVVCGLYGT